MPLRRDYASAGANRGTRCATFARRGRATVHCGGDGAHARAMDDGGATTTTRGAGARATCVETLDDGRIVVGDALGRVRVRAPGEDGGEGAVGRHARGPVRDVAAATRGTFVTCADDGDVIAWATPERNESGEELREIGRLTMASASAPLCAAVTRAPGVEERRVLAVGCVDGRTRVYACDFTNEGAVTFEACGVLDGHADWVRGVAFAPTRRDDAVFLATASQDRTARVWRVQTVPADGARASKDAAPFARLAAPPEPPSTVLVGRRVKTSLESLLIGHEDWVTSVAWHPDASKMVLMTASMDRSLVLWSPAGAPWTSEEAGSELWMSSTSLGEAAAVCLGYYGASFSPDGDAIMANSHGGALHQWLRDDDGSWRAIPGTSGHTMRVTCLRWDTAGRWLMSGGGDQTVRVHAPWHGDGPKGWRQIARPQVHGHDIVCFATMHDDAGTTTYVSGADEKVLRVFEAPGTFLGTVINSLGNTDPVAAAALTKAKNLSLESLGAELPALGLSNKALRGADAEDLPSDVAGLRAQAAQQEGLIEEYNARGVEAITPQALTHPPLEEVLAQATLWPETRKLYGHGNEIRAVAAHPSGDLIASASNALTAASAAIWVWSRGQNWKPLGTLSGATLTVTALEFTPRNAARDYLLAASRDRHVCLFAPSSRDAPRGEFGDDGWRLLTRFKAHDREIYAASWAPCGALFATAGRDKKVKIWRVVDDVCEPACELPKFTAAPTAMAFASDPDAPLAIAIGFDDGGIEVHVASADAASWTLSSRASANDRHGAAVRAVAWRPGSSAVFASAGDDHAVHVYEHE
jgi:elongator complex protein 2